MTHGRSERRASVAWCLRVQWWSQSISQPGYFQFGQRREMKTILIRVYAYKLYMTQFYITLGGVFTISIFGTYMLMYIFRNLNHPQKWMILLIMISDVDILVRLLCKSYNLNYSGHAVQWHSTNLRITSLQSFTKTNFVIVFTENLIKITNKFILIVYQTE